MTIDSSTVLAALGILALVMCIIVLYHLLFIAVDLRKITRRIENVTADVEGVIRKPLFAVDQILEFALQWLDERKGGHHKKK